MFGKRIRINAAKDFFGFKVRFSGFGGNYTNCGIFAEWNFDDLANLE